MQVHVMNDYAAPSYDGFGLSLKPSKKIKAAVKKVGKAVGKVVDNKVVKGLTAATLAVTGVGAPAAAAIMAAQSAGGKALQGKRITTIAKGAVTGAATGAAAGVAGKFLPKLPGVGGAVTKLRQKVGTAPKVSSFDSDSRIDALATTPIPTVSTIPSAAEAQSSTPTLTQIENVGTRKNPVFRQKRANPIVKPVSALTQPVLNAPKLPDFVPSVSTTMPVVEAITKTQEKKKRNVLGRLKDQAAKFAKERAVDIATSVTEPPSANPSAPQGGFPAIPATMSPGNQNQDSEIAPKSGGLSDIPPVMWLAVAAVGFLALNKGR